MAYTPPNLSGYVRPVQFEAPSQFTGLSIVELTDGRGLLMWVNANRVRYAIKSSPAAFLVDNVVASGDAMTALSGAGDIRAASVFRVGTSVYFSVNRRNPTTAVGYNEVYVANSGSNPTAWSLHGTVQAGSTGTGASYGYNWNPECAGIPYVSGSAWVITGGFWSSDFGQYIRRAGVWESSNGGVTWANKVNAGYYSGGSYMEWQAVQLAAVPGTGQVATMAGTDSSGRTEREMFVGPGTWTITDQTYSDFLNPFTTDGNYAYAMTRHGKVKRSPAGAVLPMSSWTEVGQYAVGPNTVADDWSASMRGVLAGGGWFYSWLDRLAYDAAMTRRPVVGHIGFR